MDNKSNIYSNFDYLGYINLSDNASSMYKSRELKSVSLPVTEASFIKLKLHKPHANAHNIYEQVGRIFFTINTRHIVDKKEYKNDIRARDELRAFL